MKGRINREGKRDREKTQSGQKDEINPTKRGEEIGLKDKPNIRAVE